MDICIKQHPSNIWSSNHEKVKQEAQLKKNVAYKKGVIKIRCFMSLCDNIPLL